MGGIDSMILITHPTGNQNSRYAVLAMREVGLLHQFVTALHLDISSSWFGQMLPHGVSAELSRRNFSIEADGCVASRAVLREATRLLAGRYGPSSLVDRETGWASVDKVYRAVDDAAAKMIDRGLPVSGVYAYEDGAFSTFRSARQRGLACLYELPIGYWRAHRRICAEEAGLHPEWAHTWNAGRDRDEKVRRKDDELSLASQIIVPSRFVSETLRDFPGDLAPVSIVPYGCPTPIRAEQRQWYEGGPLKVLFVGGLSQRKGMKYLIDAIAPLGKSVSLTVIGAGPGRTQIGKEHRLLDSVPHSVVLDEMRRHDVFVFPTLFEGYSLAVAEALSQGMVVITTPNSGAADIITDGHDGWIVPIRESEGITERLQACIENPRLVQEMGKAALKRAGSWTWTHYRERLRSVGLNAAGVAV